MSLTIAKCSTNTNYTNTGISSPLKQSVSNATEDLGGMVASIALPAFNNEIQKKRYCTYIGSIFTIYEVAGPAKNIPYAWDNNIIEFHIRGRTSKTGETIGGWGHTYSTTFQYRGQLDNGRHRYDLIAQISTT